MQRGFDSFYGATVGEIDHFEHTAHGVPDWYRGNAPVVEGFDNTLIGQGGEGHQGHDPSKPLFLYLAFTAPHTPYQAPQAYLDRYEDIADPNKRAYAAMISVMDDEVGKVVAALDARGCATTPSSSSRATMAAPRACSLPAIPRSRAGFRPATRRCATARARSTKAARGCRPS